MTVRHCPSCGSDRLELFHELDGVPAHSCLLLDDQAEAVGYPTGSLALAVCTTCGFITNTRFDVSMNEYSDTYEETQGFSPTFNRFAEELAQDWVDRFDIRNKRVLEIGCGKGEFLALVCRLGENQGFGVDPAVAPGRLTDEDRARCTFIPELYTPAHGTFDADVVLCRHTLEHIAPVGEFVRLIHDQFADRPATPILFELPDVGRVLDEIAYWDLYYEHCSYFTPGSLARLFRQEGFEVSGLWTAFDDQYILLEATVGAGPVADAPLAIEESPEQVVARARSFADRYALHLKDGRSWLAGERDAGRRVVIWGAGSKGVAFLTTLDADGVIDRAVDINPYKQDKFLAGTGVPVVSPESLRQDPPDTVILMNAAYVEEVRAHLARLGLSAVVTTADLPGA